MADDLHNRGPKDADKINLNEEWEVKYWTQLLGCTAGELKEAVSKWGNSSQLIKDYFQK